MSPNMDRLLRRLISAPVPLPGLKSMILIQSLDLFNVCKNNHIVVKLITIGVNTFSLILT